MTTCILCHKPIMPGTSIRHVIVAVPPGEGEKMMQGEPAMASAAPAHVQGACSGPVTLKCACCGHEEFYENCEDAFQAGWDEPDHLPSWPLCCPLCPGVAAMGLFDHSKAHARWEHEGRPKSFETELVSAAPTDDFGPED